MRFNLSPKTHTFAGSRQRVSPFPNYISLEIMCRETRDLIGTGLKDTFVICEGRLMNFFAERASMEKASQSIVQLVQKNPKLFHDLVEIHQKHATTFLTYTRHIIREVQENALSNDQLYKYYTGFEAHYRAMYIPYAPVWIMGDAMPSLLYRVIAQRIAHAPEATEALDILTQEPRAMLNSTERKDLLTLADEIAKNKDWVELVAENNAQQDPELDRKIQKHLNDYFWITRDYEDPVLTHNNVIEKLKDSLNNSPEDELKEIERAEMENKHKRRELIAQCNFTEHELQLFDAMKEATYLKELRKRYVSEGLYYFDTILSEIAKRLFLSLAQVRFMQTSDVRKALVDGIDTTSELNERMKLSVWYSRDGTSTLIITGKQAQDIRNAFLSVDKDARELVGVPVSPGVARGPVKIVMNPDECGKVDKGDVIVTVQVVPSFSTAIIKCAAIVCDGGTGITSHPATLSREAGVPCVIQTRFAREVLKDGDIVEVDGYKGVVRKLDSKNQK